MVALIGGALALLMVLVVLALVFVIGGGPTSTVEDYFNATRDRDCQGVKDTLSSDLGEGFDVDECEDDTENFLGDEGATDGCDLELSNEEEDGDEASVDFKVSGCDEGDRNSEGSVDLVKEDGDWKIDGFGE